METLNKLTDISMDGSGTCTACGAEAELNDENACPDCADDSTQSQDAVGDEEAA